MRMFELTIAFRYLIPRKKSLSTALVSLLSVDCDFAGRLARIGLFVRHAGIERNWLQKLTSLHAPLRLTPTEYYYNSYYYQADSVAAASGYSLKTIGEKAESQLSDPYSEQLGCRASRNWPSPERHPDGQNARPRKGNFALLNELKVDYQDYEISGALHRLTLSRPPSTAGAGATLSQMSYLLSFMDRNPRFASLILPPSAEDLDSMLKNSSWPIGIDPLPCRTSKRSRVSSFDPLLIPENSCTHRVDPSAKLERSDHSPRAKISCLPHGWQKGYLKRNGSSLAMDQRKAKLVDNPSIRTVAPLALIRQ